MSHRLASSTEHLCTCTPDLGLSATEKQAISSDDPDFFLRLEGGAAAVMARDAGKRARETAKEIGQGVAAAAGAVAGLWQGWGGNSAGAK